jgi:hypothetical protein
VIRRITLSILFLMALLALSTAFTTGLGAHSSQRLVVGSPPQIALEQTPSPSPTATLGPPSDLEVRPGPKAVHVIVVGFISGDTPVYARQIQVIARDAKGRTIELGTSDDPAPRVGPFSSFYFTFAKPLPSADLPYAIQASLPSLGLASTSQLLIAPIPDDAGKGNAHYIATRSLGRGGRPGQIFRRGFDRDNWLVFTSLDGKRRFRGYQDGLVPLIVDPEIQQLRKVYYGRSVVARKFFFTCYNAKDESERAEFVPGRPIRVDEIARAAHALQWLPDDAHEVGNGSTGIFVDSPIVADFKLSPHDFRIIPPTFRSGPKVFSGNCIGGFAMFPNGATMTFVLRPA